MEVGKVDAICQADGIVYRHDMVLFYRSEAYLSQHYPCKFKARSMFEGDDRKHEFNCTEQYMMFEKAMLFKDYDSANKILRLTDPVAQKAAGRKVINFIPSEWIKNSMDIVERGNFKKFTQNPDLWAALDATSDKLLVEASPRDVTWGIGLAATNPLAYNRTTWRGKNQLGACLMKTRAKIRQLIDMKRADATFIPVQFAQTSPESKESSPPRSSPIPKKPTVVVHIKRKDGQVVQDCDIYIGRAMNQGGWRLKSSKWANPFKIKEMPNQTAREAVDKYREWIQTQPDLLASITELKGKVLGCWCKPGPCHGDVLVELANKL